MFNYKPFAFPQYLHHHNDLDYTMFNYKPNAIGSKRICYCNLDYTMFNYKLFYFIQSHIIKKI